MTIHTVPSSSPSHPLRAEVERHGTSASGSRDPGRERSRRAVTAAQPRRVHSGVAGMRRVLRRATSPVAAAAPLRASHRAKEPNGEDAQLPGTIEPQICSSCSPPLAGMGRSWTPTAPTASPSRLFGGSRAGGAHVPAAYEDLLDQYVHDIAAASGSTITFSRSLRILPDVDGLKKYISYKFTGGTPIVDTAAFPANGCKPAPGYSACISDTQLRAE